VKELADFITSQTAKPIYAYADGLCASAAYWLATATGRVYAPLTAEVGSIGVIAAHVDRSAANAARGIRVTYITGGAYKAAGNPDSPLSASDQSYLQEIVSKLHAVFRDDVAAHMPVDAANPKAWGDGQIFLADTALELGLLTGIVTDMDELLVLIKKEIHMDKEELAKKHPELLAQIEREASAAACEAAKVELMKQHDSAAANLMGLVDAVCGKEVADKITALAATGLTPQQLLAVKDALGGHAPDGAATKTEADAESEGRKEVLALLRGATPAPVNTSVAPSGGDAIKAAIDQISAVSA
jgi:ClpP class serine protease